MTDSIDYDTLVRSMIGIRTVMLTVIDPGGRLRSRPLPLLDVDADGALWVTFDPADPGEIEMGTGHQVQVPAAIPGDCLYVAISGHASIHDDPALEVELWRDIHRHWLPNWPIRSQMVIACVIPKTFQWWQGQLEVRAGNVHGG